MSDLNERPQTNGEGNAGFQFITKVKHIVSGIKSSKIRELVSRARVWQTAAACIIGVVLVSGAIFYYNSRKTGYEVLYQGESLGYIRDKNVALEALKGVKDKIQSYDSSINVSDDLTFKKLLVESDRLTTGEKIGETIEADAFKKYTAYSVSLNGAEIALVQTEDEANKLVEDVKKFFIDQEANENVKVLQVDIKDEIKIDKKIADTSKLTDTSSALSTLTSTKGVTKQIEVQSGDSIWKIARDNDMKISDIADMNPGLNVDKLQIGQKINLSVSEPYLNVQIVEEATIDENIAYSTSYVNDSNLYRGQSKVLTSGQYGINRVIKQVTKLNGKEVESTVLSASVVKDPVTQVLARGTKALVGSGAFAWPTSGNVTSPYGSRGREFHKGMDIAAPYGTAISAADSGTVSHAGWYAGYGLLVIIDHGNGYQTYYGHCSSIAVKEGQSVSRGQYIAAVGHTGDAQGNHLHFEIRQNGVNKNPAYYLP